MRIINREIFLALPSGILYSKYQPSVFGELSIKGDTRFGDFNTLPIADTLISSQPAPKDGGERPDRWCRDGLFEQDQCFAVWEKGDVEDLARTLKMANLTGKLGLLNDHAAHRVIDLKTFLALPPGVMFAKWDNEESGPLMIKGSNLGQDDFNYQAIEDPIDINELCYIDACDKAQEQGVRLKLDFECYGRDGNFNPRQLFLVWGSTDVEALIARLDDLVLAGYPEFAAVASDQALSVDLK